LDVKQTKQSIEEKRKVCSQRNKKKDYKTKNQENNIYIYIYIYIKNLGYLINYEYFSSLNMVMDNDEDEI